MKFIVQNVFGSFCRSIGRILAYMILGLLIFLIFTYCNDIKVFAANVETDFVMSDELMSAFLRKCNNSDCSSNSNIALENTSFYSFLNSSSFTSVLDDYGYIAKLRFDQALYKDYVYTLSIGVCTTSGTISGSTRANFTIGNAIESYIPVSIIGRNTNAIGGVEYRHNMETLKFSDCLVFQYAFVASENAHYINVPLNLYARNFSKYNFAILSTGVLDNLGIYSATSNDKIMDSLDKQMIEINETKKTVEDTNNYIKDETPPDTDISSIGGITGLLPAGPVDSLLNLPFSITSTLINGFSGNCQPFSINFVYDTPLEFQCFDTIIYNKIDGFVLTAISLVPSTFILIYWFKNLYKRVERATTLETNSDDEWGVI